MAITFSFEIPDGADGRVRAAWARLLGTTAGDPRLKQSIENHMRTILKRQVVAYESETDRATRRSSVDTLFGDEQ